jgi:hypothetical protein
MKKLTLLSFSLLLVISCNVAITQQPDVDFSIKIVKYPNKGYKVGEFAEAIVDITAPDNVPYTLSISQSGYNKSNSYQVCYAGSRKAISLRFHPADSVFNLIAKEVPGFYVKIFDANATDKKLLEEYFPFPISWTE